MRHFSLVLIGWGLAIVAGWTLLVPRTVLPSHPQFANVLLGIALAAAVNTIVEHSWSISRTWRPVRSRARNVIHFFSVVRRTLVVSVVLTLGLLQISC